MAESFNYFWEALEKKRDYLNMIRVSLEKQVNAAKANEWTEFNCLADQIDTIIKQVDELDLFIKEKYENIQSLQDVQKLWGEEKSGKIRVLSIEMQALVEESIKLQESSVVPITSKKEQALKELQVLELRKDTLKAYRRPSHYYKSIPRFIDKEK